MADVSRRKILQYAALLGFGTLGDPSIVRAAASQAAVPGRPMPGKSSFGFESTAEDVTVGLDLTGRTALVTGCNSGLGYETMRVLALRGAHVIGSARTLAKAEAACDSVVGRTTPIVVELTDFESIRVAAGEVRASVARLDMLILNAGIMALPHLELVYGLEKQFVVNHLGHFLLTEHLLGSLVKSSGGRVVVVSSSAHVWAPEEGIQFDNLSGESGYEPFAAYGQSKLANGLFSRELARRLADTNATSNSLHPGVIPTNLTRYLPPRDESAKSDSSEEERPKMTLKTVPQGAATSCYVATNSSLNRVTGYYFSDSNMAVPNEQMQDDNMAAKLWHVSEELTADYRA